jgi:RNA polymerase sigma-70 factor (ECF subfamily)
MVLPDEPDLIERSRSGDLQAFNSIVLAYQDQVFNLCLRMLGSVAPAEDVTQETFISAYKSIGRMRGSSVKSWLMRIAANGCIDELRRRKRHPQSSLDAAGANGEDRSLDVPDQSVGPEQLALQGELSEALQHELLQLPADQRAAVVLCDIEGMSYDEIAASLRTSVGTVKSRISRGRSRLRMALRARPELFGSLIRHTGERK